MPEQEKEHTETPSEARCPKERRELTVEAAELDRKDDKDEARRARELRRAEKRRERPRAR